MPYPSQLGVSEISSHGLVGSEGVRFCTIFGLTDEVMPGSYDLPRTSGKGRE
jgi:hypothetical protein